MATTTRPPAAPGSMLARLDAYFSITERGSSWQREVRGGLATFFTMAYIVVLNPLILGTVQDADKHFLGGRDSGHAIVLVAAATALVAGVVTLLMGVVGRYPYALATGLGLNAFVAFSIASEMSWADAMGLIVLEGVVITLLVLTGFRTAVFHAIPAELKTAIGVGIGLFIALIGFVDSGFVRAGSGTPLQLGVGGNLQGWPTTVFVVGLLLTVVLVAKRVRGAILLGIVITTVLAVVVEAIGGIGARTDKNPTGWSLVDPKVPHTLFDLPDLSLLGHFSLFGGFGKIGVVAALLLVFTLLLADFFDTMGTVVGVGAEGGLLDEDGQLPGIERVLLVDSVAAIAGGAASTSSATTYVESAAGVGEGARTGLASVVTGVLFLLAMFFTPLVQVVPFEAATPALVVVGFFMLQQVRSIDFSDVEIGIPAFLTIVVMPFTYSITNGIGAGFVSYALIKLVSGRGRQVHPLLWVVAALFVLYFAIVPVEELLGVR
ncbi:AGZA family xanthine/uracil permease-like MFS transporter [Motilibacter rhizosphaerae]|uniref:AGZA family xanthine/uracil permease-like MFS transporter n=1 Tax=Motilibacter rhizosphaerae TaxID=598652 RepID=A0A4Q7NS80_9ACTN|nr:NCS2 family permease [Motilibacter rhizosphaerae]RZS87510.1 AGZA family xanthine/uracil permease-like MFS transporter [Motilibacter rhizosphaerae]